MNFQTYMKVGKFARAPACHSIFGTKLLKESTVTSNLKRGLKMLDKKNIASKRTDLSVFYTEFH